MPDSTGFTAPPAHYGRLGEREAIDRIRDAMTDEQFAAFCVGSALKYLMRAGRKDDNLAEDLAKADWYTEMFAHVASEGALPDPRHRRGDAFIPYVRRPMVQE